MAPPYNPDWGELCPCNVDQFLAQAQKAGIKHLSMRHSDIEDSVVYFERKMETGLVLTAVLSPDISKEREITVRYLCNRLCIPVEIFNLTAEPNPTVPIPPPNQTC